MAARLTGDGRCSFSLAPLRRENGTAVAHMTIYQEGGPMVNHAHMHQKSGFIPRHTGSCRRCGGMVISTYGDLLPRAKRVKRPGGWRCINCGEYVEGQVLRNRSAQEGMICV